MAVCVSVAKDFLSRTCMSKEHVTAMVTKLMMKDGRGLDRGEDEEQV